ncbi:methyltransferase family protein [Gemmatimonadota bacterium]
MIRFVIFAAASLPVIWVSRRSLRHPTSHGFPRFIAFEAILGLMVLNAPYWFAHPFGVRQLASWLLLSFSAVFVVWGFVLLRRLGGFRPTDEVAPTFEWENTGRLVTTGIYRYIRHPMYSSLLFLAWGALLKSVTIGTLILGAAASLALAATAKAEEAENVARFGQEYRDYMTRTRRFVPFLL